MLTLSACSQVLVRLLKNLLQDAPESLRMTVLQGIVWPPQSCLQQFGLTRSGLLLPGSAQWVLPTA